MNEYRDATEGEKTIMKTLLSQLEDRDVFLPQIACCKVKEIDDTRTLDIIVNAPREAQHSVSRLCEGYTILNDGHTLSYILHQRDGVIYELEILRDDMEPTGEIPYDSPIILVP